MNGLWQRFKNEMRNPRKAGLLMILGAVALLMWGRLLLEQVPRIATAEPSVVEVVGPSATGQPWLEPVLPSEPQLPEANVELAERLPRDLFALPHDGFEMTKDARSRQTTEKLSVEAADERTRLTAVRQAATRLRLESIVTGNPPRAVINGRVLAPEQRIEGFTLVRVAERFVLLEQDGVVVRLDL